MIYKIVEPKTGMASCFLIVFIVMFTGCASSKERASLKKAHQIEFELSESESATDVDYHSAYSSTDLDTLLKIAALNNPGLKSAFYNWKSSLEQIPQARSLMDPKFGYMYYIQEVETRVGPQKHKFTLSQSLPWFGTLSLKGGIAWEKSEQARLMYEKEKLQLFYQVKDAYADYYYLGRSLSILEEKFQLLKQIEKVARIKYAAGTAMFSQIIKLQVELGRLEDMVETLKLKKKPANSRLKSLLNIQDTVVFSFPEKIKHEKQTLAPDDLWKKLMKNNPGLSALDHKIAMNNKKITLAKKSYMPNFMLGMNYIQTDESPIAGVMENGKDPVMVSATINIPIQIGSKKASVRQAQAQKKSALHAKQNLENKFKAIIANLLFKIDDSERKSKLYKDTLIPKATQALKVMQVSFSSGKAGFLDIIDAEKVLLEFENIYEKAVTDHLRTVAELEMIVGEKI